MSPTPGVTPELEARIDSALATLRDAAAAHPGRVVLATSLGAEDQVLLDLIARHRLPIAVATLDTGALHAETVALRARSSAHWGLPIEVHAPDAQAVESFVAQHGPLAMRQSVALRKACCALRKLEPLKALMAGRSAWVTGLRQEQSEARAEVLRVAPADAEGRVKYSPLADWRWSEVWAYLRAHQVPYNPLHDQHMPSIGCAPCTRAIAAGEPFRAGRWWWEQGEAAECGLHAPTEAQPVRFRRDATEANALPAVPLEAAGR